MALRVSGLGLRFLGRTTIAAPFVLKGLVTF